MFATIRSSAFTGTLVSLAVLSACSDPPSTPRASMQPSSSASAAVGPKNSFGHIAYAASTGVNSDVFIYDHAEQKSRQITTDPGSDFEPSLSADGRRIVWVHEGAGGPELRMANVDGSKMESVVPAGQYTDIGRPSFSPDGKRVIFTAAEQVLNSVYVLDLKTRTAAPIVPGSAGVFSPDGKRIAFNTFTPAGLRIFVMNIDGSDWHEPVGLCPAFETCLYPQWSPDGALILFTAQSINALIEYSIADHFSAILALNTGSGAWSPDGQRIAFIRKPANPAEVGIYSQTIPPTGEPTLWLAGTSVIGGTLSWSK